MTELFVIKVIDGQVVDHPILLSNLAFTLKDIDINNLPEPYVKFHRIHPPVLGLYEKNLRTEYTILPDGSVTDNWIKDQFTAQERQDKIDKFKQLHVPPYASWVFNEETLLYEAPIKPPINEILATLAANPSMARPNVTWNEQEQKWDIIYSNV